MQAILKVNGIFLSTSDWKYLFSILLFLIIRGKSVALLSEYSKKRLNSVTSTSFQEFSNAILSYVTAVAVVSPIDIIFNELIRRIRKIWSQKLTSVLAKKMLYRKIRDEEDDKNFETVVAAEADKFVELEVDLGIELIEALIHLYFFTQILWKLSPKLGSAGLTTALLGTSLSIFLGQQRLSQLFREEREAIGMFSHNLSRCRENLESIQFAGGMDIELDKIQKLNEIRQNTILARKREKDVLGMFSILLRRIAGGVLPPIILRREREDEHEHEHHHHGHSHNLSPNPTHAGNHPSSSSSSTELISDVSQANEAFDEILFHLLIVTENFHSFVRLVTIGQDISRLVGSGDNNNNNMNEVDSTHLSKKIIKEQEPWIQVHSLTVQVPNSEIMLLENFNISLNYGESLLITGASGCGKTALLRVLFGLWPAVTGKVIRARDDDVIALSQKPFCSFGTLKEQVTYPKPASMFSDDQVEIALKTVGLDHILSRHSLNSTAKWTEELSVGEQQRLGFSRIVLQKPLFAFFDESSSSLDLASEAKMYEIVSEIVKGGFISVGHRKSIEKYHFKKVILEGSSSGGKWKMIF